MIRAELTLYTAVKTIVDYVFAISMLILLLPLVIVLAILIRSTGEGPIIYAQERVGKDGKLFRLYKFRSMNNGENGTHLLSGKNDSRITHVGRFMRKHKLDEIPNFINILKGEMSFIGPRPEQKYFTDQLISKHPEYALIQTIKPGITSWGQVKFGYASDIDQMTKRLEYDLQYLRNRSIMFDLKIAMLTVGVILKGQGI